MATKEEVEAFVRKTVLAQLQPNPLNVVKDEDTFASLGLDSLDLTEVTMVLEDEYTIWTDIDELYVDTTVRRLIDMTYEAVSRREAKL